VLTKLADNYLAKNLENKKIDAYSKKIAFNIKFVAHTWSIKKISENIKSDVATSIVASL